MIIRPATPEDAHAVAQIRVTSWQATYRGTVPDSALDAMTPEETENNWRAVAAGEVANAELLVCEVEGAVVGFACYGAARPPDFGHGGELYATYYLPEAMGKGYGTRMVAQVVRCLARMGHSDMILWVMEANARGRRFYDGIGGTVVPDSRRSFEIDGREIWEIAYGFRPLPDLAAKR
ncbi:MAG TPA: GNAT family N-acetyltransferase [Rhizomicrobium sp.]|jgi:GNAT superfamily N-acetyltransferase|nr:GNAT family N-acetyltransferase [Rhizomicrobium sp.]